MIILILFTIAICLQFHAIHWLLRERKDSNNLIEAYKASPE